MRQSLRDDANEDDDDGLRAKKRPKAKAKAKGKLKKNTKAPDTETGDPETKVMLAALEAEDHQIRNEIDLPEGTAPAHGRGKGKGRGRGQGRCKRGIPTQPTVEDSYLNCLSNFAKGMLFSIHM